MSSSQSNQFTWLVWSDFLNYAWNKIEEKKKEKDKNVGEI